MKSRTGKIARLPKKIRDQLNRRLQDGGASLQLLEWLNALPSVRRVLREYFTGQPITEQNLSQWRKGGYLDWLRHQETQLQTRWMIERSDDVPAQENGQYLCERLARILTAELAQHIHELDSISSRGERWKQFREISAELSRLRYGTHYARAMNLSWERWGRIVEKEDAASRTRTRSSCQKRGIAGGISRTPDELPSLARHPGMDQNRLDQQRNRNGSAPRNLPPAPRLEKHPQTSLPTKCRRRPSRSRL